MSSSDRRSTSRKRQHPNDSEEENNGSAGNENVENMDISDDEGGTMVDGIYIPPPIKPVETFKSDTRLIITKITNNFFKSYADEQVLGPFHKCFNAIVGPNGSGKSNVIDSMLFVFGYRAAKIRSKNVSVLLHNSEKYRHVQSCTVSVHFCEIRDKPGDDYEIIAGSEFVVSRTANKDNSSFYQLNDRRVQFKEVGQLLKKHGVDLDHNRFLILQGEVEEIAMMKCKASNENETGMLEYLEDIIGTNKYKKPLDELVERIERLSEQRTEKLNRLQLVKKELDQLEEPMQEAVGFLKAENTIVTCRNLLYQKNICELETKAKTLEEEKSTVSEAHQKLMARLNDFAREKDEKDKRLKQEATVYENLVQRKDKLKEAFDKADKKDVQLQADMQQTNTTRKKNKELLASERKKLEDLQLVPEKNAAGIEECEAKAVELTAKREKLEEDKTKLLANLRTETQDLQKQKEELESKLTGLKEAVDKTKSTYTLAESELKIYVANEENERDKLEKQRQMCENSEQAVVKTTEELSQLKRNIPNVEKALKSASQELETVRREEAKHARQLTENRAALEEKRSSMQANRSRGRVLDSLMQQKREGKCSGIYGRLGDLGAIDGKYDVAISTACGKLDDIVVDTVNTAQWCIEFLKKHDIGRATFIALDKQEHLRQLATSSIRTPENVPRLYDLIQIQDDTVRTAFYFSLRDTLVATDLDQATRIAYGAQRYRVVTLKGDLIETSGTMSGGGRTVLRGKMGRSVVVDADPRAMEKMESDLTKLEDRVRELQQKQNTLESRVNELEPELRQMKINYEKLSANLQFLKQQRPLLLEQLKAQEIRTNSIKANPVRVKELTAIVEKNKIEYEKALEKAGELQASVDELTQEIKEKTSGKMKAMDKSLNDVTKQIDKCKQEITRLKVATKTAQRNVKTTTEKISTLEKDIEKAENNLKRMKAERDEIESDAQKLLTCIEEITEKLTSKEEAYTELKNEVAALTKEENELKSEKVDIDQSLKTVTKKLNDCNATIHQWHAKLKHLKLQDIPHEEVEALKQYNAEELDGINRESVELELQSAENIIKSAKPNLNAIEEYQKAQKFYMQRSEELEQITTKRTEMRGLHEKVKNRRKDEFLSGYALIKLKLKEMYQMITLGGDADFEIVDSFDPFAEGIQFNVRPPKKSWKKISNLSGGEKTLSSLALVFALHYYKPSPLYVMDEIDAALDFKNVSIVGHYIKERTKNAQFIIISLRSNMFELADNLIGIYKIFNCTQTITIDPRAYENGQENQPTSENRMSIANVPVETVAVAAAE